MGSDDDMFRIWSGPEGSSHKEPLSGIRIHRAHVRFLVPRHGPAGDEVFGVSLALPKHWLLRALGASDRCPYICNELLTHLQGSPYYHESD